MSHNVVDDPWYMPEHAIPIAKSCSDCGEFLGMQQFWLNGKNGRDRRSECTTCAKTRVETSGTAWHIPRTGILIAKTCTDCGNLLMAQRFWRNGKPGRWCACARCMKRRNYRYNTQVA